MTKDEDTAALLYVVGKSTIAAQAATDAVKEALQALPDMLATALAHNNAAPALQPNAQQPNVPVQPASGDLRDRRVPDLSLIHI